MPRKERYVPAEVLVVGLNHFRVSVLIAALQEEGFPAVGATRLTGFRTALQEFPSIRTVMFLYSEDVVSPMECVVMRVEQALVSNFCALADAMGWICGETSGDPGNVVGDITLPMA